jgi:hypothetical protein
VAKPPIGGHAHRLLARVYRLPDWLFDTERLGASPLAPTRPEIIRSLRLA